MAEEKKKKPNPFSPETLALRGNPAEQIGAKRALVHVPVRKPNKKEWIRVHPDEGYNMMVAILETDNREEVYVVTPEIAASLLGETKSVMLTLTITRQGTVFLWPVPLPNPDGRTLAWHVTAREAAEMARKGWVRMAANMSAAAYDIWEIKVEIADPEWPDYSFEKLLEVAFGRDRLIDSLDHPVIRQLLGKA